MNPLDIKQANGRHADQRGGRIQDGKLAATFDADADADAGVRLRLDDDNHPEFWLEFSITVGDLEAMLDLARAAKREAALRSARG